MQMRGVPAYASRYTTVEFVEWIATDGANRASRDHLTTPDTQPLVRPPAPETVIPIAPGRSCTNTQTGPLRWG